MRSALVAACAATLAAGCANNRLLRQHCPPSSNCPNAAEVPPPSPFYPVGCPDVLAVSFADYPHWDAVAVVDVDGRLPLVQPGNPRVEGKTLDEIRTQLAELAQCPAERVNVSLLAARRARIVIYGPIRGRARAVPYQGPETVTDFLQRNGGLPPGSQLRQVYVIRPNVALGMRPQVFRIDVAAALECGDHPSNIVLQADDQIFIGETLQSRLSRVLPDWLDTIYRRLTGLLPEDWWPFSKLLQAAGMLPGTLVK
jgi:protein involved in polysaccharide export with SLBB domain